MEGKLKIQAFLLQSRVSIQDENEDAKLADIAFAVVDNVNMRCNCSFTDDGVLYRRFQCFGFNSDSVTFRGGLRGLADVNSSVLAEYVLAWVASEDNVTLQGVQFKFEHSDMDEEVVTTEDDSK